MIPVKEDTQANPVNNYGKTKLFGDLACLKNNPSSIIIRTAWLYSSFGNNFVKKMINLMKSKSELNVINDQVGSPTFAADLAEVILQIINANFGNQVFIITQISAKFPGLILRMILNQSMVLIRELIRYLHKNIL